MHIRSLAFALCVLLAASASDAAAQQTAGRAVSTLDVADGLEATLFASEPMLVNPTNIDIDARGRVWVCEGYNYRMHLNPENPKRDEGDRILILEDTDGDGRADKQQVYYQGTDVNSALGIAVLGNKVIVSASPNIIVFTDTDGDDRPDEKEVLFTGIGGEQHDHAVHAFIFGPDGKLYFNFGNAGKQLRDGIGNLVIDKAGNRVIDDGNPYREGMIFRLDPDGSNLEVMAHNFRNNYEVAVDAFGTMWQSDNDDDGNRGVRINYVMDYGNYGYRDEMTGAGWRERRTGMHEEIPKRHWHLNDPGVVPNLLQTGAGSPTGMVIYEGNLLPRVFHGQMIHTDAGPNVVRSYPVRKDGAGYTAEVVNILEGARDQWFRPSDVAVAPDGSLIVADWYDPGVGGHQVGDLDRGRLFRVAPPNTPYRVPKVDVSTPEGAIEALKSPNLATRYLAWTALHAWQRKAEPALLKLWEDDNPRFKARALWLLAKIEGRAAHYVETALAHANSDIRVMGLRIARQLEMDLLPYIRQAVRDASPQVRREAAIALRHLEAPEAADLWADLALQYDGQDRWYLEALGIAADRQWDAFFAAWRERVGDDWDSAAGRDIVWRARARAALPLLADLIRDEATSPEGRLRYFRAFDFHRDASKQDVLLSLLDGTHPDQPQITALALHHLDAEALQQSPKVEAALNRTLALAAGTQQFVDLVARYDLRDRNEELLRLALKDPGEDVSVAAGRLLLRSDGADLLAEAIGRDEQTALAALTVLGRIESRASQELAESVMLSSQHQMKLRRLAVQAVGRGWSGENRLLDIVQTGRLPSELEPTAASILFNAYREGIRKEAAQHLSAPGTAGGDELPPVRELVGRQGDAARGAQVFTAVCGTCHQVNGEGINYGPKLSEIGSKLSKEALYEAILHPSAGISFGYEGYMIKTKDGAQAVGYIASETSEAIDLAMPGGQTNRIAKSDIVERTALEASLMPANLQRSMTEEELVDLVEYLTTLRTANP